MERVLLPVELGALAIGVGILLVLLLSFQRGGRTILLDLGLAQAGATLLIVLNVVDAYGLVTAGTPGPSMGPVAAVLAAAGCGLVGYAIPSFAQHVVGVRPRGWSLAWPPLIAVVYAAGGAAFSLAGFEPGAAIMVSLLQLQATIVIVIHRRAIPAQDLRMLVLPLLFLVAGVVALQAAVLLIQLWVPQLLAPSELVPVASYAAISAILLRYSVKVLFLPATAHEVAVSQPFVERYGISPREAEIIGMILEGHTNRTIGARLYISDRTVKNHVYSIYRKTGATNKVQLLNLVGRRSAEE